MLKKLTKAVLCMAVLCSLTGCFGKKDKKSTLNADRGTDYTCDFVQYLDAEIYGSEGHGFLEIKPKDIQVSDFKSEKEFIAVKKTLASLKPYYDPDAPNKDSNLLVSKGTDLSNGDVVTIGISEDFDGNTNGLKMNLEPYEFKISGLEKAKSLDLFDSTSVSFLALDDGTNTIYPVKIYDGKIPNDILSQITYSAATEDEIPVAGKSLISVSAKIDPLIDENGNPEPTTLATWLGKKGYLAKTEDEKVLREIASPISFTAENQAKASSILYRALKKADDSIISVATIQQLFASEGSYDPYAYTVTYYARNDSESSSESPTVVKRASVKMAYGENAGIAVLNVESSGYTTDDTYGSQAFSGMELKAIYTGTTIDQESATDLLPSEETSGNTGN